MQTVVVFSNRTETLLFYKVMQRYRIVAKVINTPGRVKFSCSISVVIPTKYKPFAENVIKRNNFQTFVKFI